MDHRPIPRRAIAAARRIVGPARLLGGVFQVLWVVSAVAGGLTTLGLVVAVVTSDATAVTVAVVAALAALLFVPAWWLRRARSTFADLTELPQRLQSLCDDGAPFTVTREDLSSIHRGDVLAAARTLRTTVSEVSDFVSPASSVIEAASPPFWVWSAACAVATVLLVLFALLSMAFLLLG